MDFIVSFRHMDKQPIGIFDSGLGGLTVLRDIQALLPHENLVYIADSAYAPYGEKAATDIASRCLLLANILIRQHHIQALVVACNTATAVAIHALREQLDIPVIGVEPAIKPAVGVTASGVVGVLATENTLKSDKFSNLLDAHQHKARIITQPCFGLVEAVEKGETESESTYQLLSTYVMPMLDEGVDTIVLGCTHYPLIEPLLRKLVGNQVHIMSTGAAVAKQLKKQLQGTHAKAEGTALFYTSGDTARVSDLASRIFHRKVDFQGLGV